MHVLGVTCGATDAHFGVTEQGPSPLSYHFLGPEVWGEWGWGPGSLFWGVWGWVGGTVLGVSETRLLFMRPGVTCLKVEV